jgi:hypothetical protein
MSDWCELPDSLANASGYDGDHNPTRKRGTSDWCELPDSLANASGCDGDPNPTRKRGTDRITTRRVSGPEDLQRKAV